MQSGRSTKAAANRRRVGVRRGKVRSDPNAESMSRSDGTGHASIRNALAPDQSFFSSPFELSLPEFGVEKEGLGAGGGV
jgi:hypothetical protein